MKFGQLHHIEYYVRDLDQAKIFWGWLLPLSGYEEYQKWDGGISWRHETGTYICFVQLSEASKLIQNDRQGNGLNHIAFMGKDRVHLKLLVEELQRRQIKIFASRPDYVWFEDSNGLAAEIYLSDSP
ncbi:MAG: VOC family protein [Pseudobdellovibrionaceae bacterium]